MLRTAGRFDLWWLPRPVTRTYYRVDADGRQDHPVPGPHQRPLVQTERLMGPGYVELHAKSFYSFGVGASHVHELLAQVKEYGYSRTCPDRYEPVRGAGVCSGSPTVWIVQPITGGEITLTDGSRLTLLAKTRSGYSNISRLFTLSSAVDRREPRLDPSHLSARPLRGRRPCSPADAMGGSHVWL